MVRSSPSHVRLDIWLDVSCLFRTRSEAQKACQMGRVEVNGQRAKAHRDVKAGDAIVIQRPFGRRQHIVVRQVEDTHVAKAVARTLYEDVTPPPSPEELELRQLASLARSYRPSPARPDSRQRRTLRSLKEQG
ncbi:MAG: RNA-binding S4 domain-containing protein [Vicinamibacterales bacterium]